MKKKLLIIALILVSLLLGGYFTMVLIFNNKFQANTIINGEDYSFKTVEYVANDLNNKKTDYSIKVNLRNDEFTIKASDIDLIVSYDEDVKKIKDSQNSFAWLSASSNPSYIAEYHISFNADKLTDYLNTLPAFDKSKMILPSNPIIEYKDGKVTLSEGNQGTTLDTSKATDIIKDAILNNDNEVSIEDCYVKALYDINSPNVQECYNTINDYINLKIKYIYTEKASIDITAEDIYNMLDVDTEKYTCSLNKEKVAKFVSDFANKYDTFGKDRLFTTTDGKTVKVNNDYFGWEIDQEKEIEELFNNIQSKTSIEREPIFLHTAHVFSTDNYDIGDSYVEFDLTNQKVHFYMNGKKILSDDIISGNPNRYQNTPGGLYEIYSMSYDVMLTGPGYASHVDYWMPFNGEIGMHDAHWQSTFGGDVYLSRGSHGCVNLPYKTAETIWNMGYRGLPVVCYWRNENYLVD